MFETAAIFLDASFNIDQHRRSVPHGKEPRERFLNDAALLPRTLHAHFEYLAHLRRVSFPGWLPSQEEHDRLWLNQSVHTSKKSSPIWQALYLIGTKHFAAGPSKYKRDGPGPCFISSSTHACYQTWVNLPWVSAYTLAVSITAAYLMPSPV